MAQFVSPKYLMQLVESIYKALEKEYRSETKQLMYLDKWNNNDRNKKPRFRVIYDEDSGEYLELEATLHGMDSELLLEIAVDLGLETPDFIPSIATFRNEIKSSYKTANATFEKATRQIEQDPSMAIALANSALESIIKEILQSPAVQAHLVTVPDLTSKPVKTSTLNELTNKILKVFELYPGKDVPNEVKTISSSLLSINKAIEDIRSTKTYAHGKTDTDYVVDDALYAYFVVNSVATVGLFLKSYYEKKFKVGPKTDADDDMPF